jgi:hypothetical protein
MQLISSLSVIFIGFGTLLFLGTGLTLYLLPTKLRSYTFYIAPAIGYIGFCFFSIWFSGVGNVSVIKSNLWALYLLGMLTVLAFFQYRSEITSICRSAKSILVIVGVMLLVVHSPVLLQGIDFYVGTVNPDFYQSLSFHEALVRFNAKFWVDHTELPLKGPFLEMFPNAFQARFGAVVFSILQEQLFGYAPRTALILSIIIFLLCLPGVVYFFCSSVLEFGKRESLIASVLVAVAAPTTMSFIHTFVGQNSALATLPLAIGLIYLAIKERSIKLMFLSSIVLNGIFWIYVMVLPYILAPIGLFCLISMIRDYRCQFNAWLQGLCVFVFLTFIVHLGVAQDSFRFIHDLSDLLGKLTHSHYYADFLTEEVLQYATGLTAYPLSQSMYFKSTSHEVSLVMIVLGILIAVFYFTAVRLWSLTASRCAVTIASSMLVVYTAVWFNYTFFTRYGYASFKMSAWLQFVFVPFLAWYSIAIWDTLRSTSSWRVKSKTTGMFVLLLPIYLGLNLASDLDYSLKSFGNDRLKGSIVNSYGIGGNPNFIDLPENLRKHITNQNTLAVGFGDSIENFWAAYYADGIASKISILTHEEIPLEDAWLPDVHTRKYKDSLGQTQIDSQRFFNSGHADYYLLRGKNNLNKEIIDSAVSGKMVWGDDTFSLYKNGDIYDLIVLGRGFYRVEYMNTRALSWWWPETFRWSAEGGEVYHLMPSQPGKPYRIHFSAIAGLGQISGQRTIELWHNGVKFDEVIVDGASRLISQPYFPIDDVNRLVLLVKEKSALVPRGIGLWNRDLPRRSTPISVLFSNIRVVDGSQSVSVELPRNTPIEPKNLFNLVESFNGFDVDGWVRDRAQFSALASAGVSKVEFHILVPGNLEFTFPYKVKFMINGNVYEKAFAEAGNHIVSIDIPKTRKAELLEFKFLPQVAKRLADGMEQREVLQSVRLSSVTLFTN